MIKNRIEIASHLFFWVFMVSALNVNWMTNWFDQSLRPNTPAPLSVIVFAIFFYVNTFVLLPKYFSLKSWRKYVTYSFLLFIIPELIRLLIYKLTNTEASYNNLLFNRDSFLFGAPSPFSISITTSFIYRFVRDRFHHKTKIQELEVVNYKRKKIPYEDSILLSDQEAIELERLLNHQLISEEIFLKPDLTLKDVADAVGSSEKKVSYLVNQFLKTSFYELINKHRVIKFKDEIGKPENKNLSIVGIAYNCGFSSKSSFYRAFKSQVSMSPSEYIKNLRNIN